MNLALREILDLLKQKEYELAALNISYRGAVNKLTLYTDWNKVSEDLGIKISNQGQRDAYIKDKTQRLRNDLTFAQVEVDALKREHAAIVLELQLKNGGL